MAWGAWVVWTVSSVLADAASAREELRAVRSDLDARSILESEALDELAPYSQRFAHIGDRLDNPLLAPLRVLPVVGRQLAAASHQATAAADGLSAAVDLGHELQQTVDGGLGAGPTRVETLHEVASIARRARTTFDGLDLGPHDALVGPVATARNEMDETLTEVLDGLDRTELMSVGLADFFEGPGDYLLLAANNAQMQNGQGMFLSGGVLHVEAGRMDLGSMQPLDHVPEVEPPVPLDPDLLARWGWLDPNHDVRHLGLSHRFPVTADTASRIWTALGNTPVDGVVVVDPVMLRVIMEATGPVQTTEGEHSRDDVLEFVLHGQYQGYLADGADRSYTEERRDELDEIARTVLEELEDVEELEPEFLDSFRSAASGRHLLMWSADRTVQAAFEAADLDGQISPDSLLLSLVNRSGVKLDWFIRMAADLSIERHGDVYEAELEIEVTNRAPSEGEPRYVVGPYRGSGLDRGEYLGLVTVNLPVGSTNNRFEVDDPLAVAGPDGDNRTVATWVRVKRGATARIVVRFELPASMAEVLIEPSARAFPTAWSYNGKQWKDRERRTVAL